ncbi:MAG: thioredoxin [Omnitrophica bacterium RIFCSPHIGHO2_02_FULL_46_11]|nr:MAG: thioredoxin [Omnitrophica bacterium RIFCSPHIGHO2_02_FULL_46_11]OGW87778.1 MAG: thioredoxin [Omnitrophica bacterium RIFCSPLOWO2_01_FULL_45_10b]
MSEAVFTDGNFKSEVLDSKIPVLVDFWAEWCAPCRMVAPIVEKLAKEYAGKLKVGKINVDDNSQTPTQYGVQGIPTLIFFKGGQVAKQVVGFQPEQKLKSVIDELLE